MKKSKKYKVRRRPLRRGLRAAVVIAVLAIVACIVWYEVSAPGFMLEPTGQQGYALTIMPLDGDSPLGYLRVEKKHLGRKARMYQRFTGAYLVDDTYVIYASDAYAKAYNESRGTNYTCFALTELPTGGIRFKGYTETLYPYNSANMACYWVECQDEDGGIYYKNAATGHELKVWGASESMRISKH